MVLLITLIVIKIVILDVHNYTYYSIITIWVLIQARVCMFYYCLWEGKFRLWLAICIYVHILSVWLIRGATGDSPEGNWNRVPQLTFHIPDVLFFSPPARTFLQRSRLTEKPSAVRALKKGTGTGSLLIKKFHNLCHCGQNIITFSGLTYEYISWLAVLKKKGVSFQGRLGEVILHYFIYSLYSEISSPL